MPRTAPSEVADHQKLYGQAQRMIHSPKMTAFDLSTEPKAIREAYGDSPFAAGLPAGPPAGRDGRAVRRSRCSTAGTRISTISTRSQAAGRQGRSAVRRPARRSGQPRHARQHAGRLDGGIRPHAAHQRPRRPRPFSHGVQRRAGRGGHPRRTSDRQDRCWRPEVTDRPVKVPDLFASFCHALGIDAGKENMSSIGRPIKIVDGGQVVNELFA